MHDEVCETLYCSTWYNIRDPIEKQRFLFILANSHRRVGLKLYGTILLSFEAFAEVCKSAYSVATFVNNAIKT